MLFDTKTIPTRKELIVDLATFAGTVVIAIVQDWKAADIIWASWIASLLIGLSFFLILALKKLGEYASASPTVEPRVDAGEPGDSTEGEDSEDGSESEDHTVPKPMEGNPGCLFLAVGGLMALLAWFAGPGFVRTTLSVLVVLAFVAMFVSILAPRGWLGVSLEKPVVRAFVFLPTSLFMIFFFLMHFGGFHLGHAFVLSIFVPPEVGVEVVADSVVADPLATDQLVADSLVGQAEEPADFGEALAELREALVEARGAFVVFLGLLILTYWPYVVSVAIKSFKAYSEALLAKSKRGEEMLLPYKNVIRVHLLIFVLIPFAALGSGLMVTVLVMFFYFFPVESVVVWVKNR